MGRKGRSINSPETPDVTPGWYTDPCNSEQIRYFDGRQWTGDAAPRLAAPPVGYPLGQRILCLRALPQRADVDVACSVDDVHGRQLAAIRSVSKVRFIDRDFATISFGLLNQQGAPTLYFTRYAGFGSKDRLEINDTVTGQDLGRLRRINGVWQGLRSSRVDMELEFGAHVLGRARVCIEPNGRFAEVNEPIYDSTGRAVAAVRRKWRYAGMINDFYDYTLECAHPTTQEMSRLLLATAFAHYLYDRLAIGGPTESIQRFAHRNRI